MKKRFSRLLSMFLVICLLFTTVTYAECSHDWDFLYDPVGNYDPVDEEYHKIVSETLYYICSDCGETKIETYPASTQYESKHRFDDDNVCYTCGYELEGEEVHEHDWEFLYDPESNYEIVDEDYHKIVSTTLYYICSECGEEDIVVEKENERKSKHNFNSRNICRSCGYEREIHEHDWKLEYDPEYEYEFVDENYHATISITYYYYCTECDETDIEVDSSVYIKNKHSFNSKDICRSCGYEKKVHEHDWEFEYDPEYHYEIVDENYHETVCVTLFYYCTECGARDIEVDYSVYSKNEHNFNSKNICGTCGYKKVVVVTSTPTLAPTATPTQTPTPSLAPTATPTQTPTPSPVPTATPTQTPSPKPTATPTVTPKPTNVPTPTPMPVPTATPTMVPTAIPTSTAVPTPAPTVHICTYENSYWRQDYKYYNDEMHTYRLVVTPICTVCGENGEKENTLEYEYHKIENGVCKKCDFVESLASVEEKKYATDRIKELDTLLNLVITAMENGEILDEDANNAIKLLSRRIYNYKEVQNGTRKLSTIEESPAIDVVTASEAHKLLIKSGFGRNVPDTQRVAYYQMIHGLEVTGWVTEETYYSIIATTQVKAEISSHLVEAKNYSAEKLVDLIGSGIQFIQNNKDNKETCDAAYAEIEILVNYLKQKPEYLSNYSLADVDWIFKVGEETPGFKDLVDLAFTKENIFSDGTGTLVQDYLDQYNMQYAANTLTVIDGVLIISVGGVIIYEYATTGTVVLTVGSQTAAQVYDQVVAYGQKVMNLSKQTIDHIFKGYVKNNGKISGVHFEKYLDDGITVVKKGATNSYGVYQGDIYVNGNLAKASSTFFPENWSYTQVIDAINQAYNNIKEIDSINNTLMGVSDSGIKILFYLNDIGEISSAFPLFK